MPRRCPLSLRAHLIWLLVGAAIPGPLLAAILISRTFADNRALVERRLLDAARVDAASLDRELEGTIRALQALATSPALDTHDLEGFYTEARRVQEVQRDWYTVVLLTLDGQQLVNTAQPWGVPLWPAVEPESVEELVTRREPVVGRVRSDPHGGRERRFAVRVPVIRNGQLSYVLTAALEIHALSRVVRSQLPASEEWTRTILDPDGTVVVRTREAERFIGRALAMPDPALGIPREGVIRETALEGTEVYAAFSQSAYGWTAAIVVPRGVLDAPIGRSQAALLTGGVILMFCGLLAVLVVSRRLSHDLTAAADGADALAAGQPVAPVTARVAETDRLSRSLRTAAALLEQRQRERDEEVRRAGAAQAQAEEANRTKDQFLAVLGHELRNPLAPALTALELMKARDPEAFARERKVLERQVAHMLRLVNDLLDVSRLARGKIVLRLQRFDVGDAVARAVDMVRPLVEEQGHQLTVGVPDDGLPLEGDEDRIVQVLANLLSNAAKFTPRGGHIALTAHAVGDMVVIACEDDGPGVPPDLPDLFEPFAQGPRPPDRPEGGLGLGLALARNLTELHGGSIHLESRPPGAGSRFEVRLPVARGESRPSPAPDVEVRRPRAAHRVLLVDDNADALAMLRTALESLGHAVATASDGAGAIAAAAGFRPDVAVLDIGLPGMSGYELARRLRRQHRALRLIALTGYGRPADVEAAARSGFDAHCVKPVTLSTLLQQMDPGAGSANVA